LGFTVRYTFSGEEKSYLVDCVIQIDDGRGADDYLNLSLEVSDEACSL
jgi:type III restriction enzyme